jgi:curved DNA-binding protein CbpA
MGTLYDLLGALPDDNAEGLRTAFRKAAKATHPDLNPDNPEAALRFRQLVRAHDILSDEEQRATYDQLLAIALLPPPARSKRVYEKVHRFASSTIAATIITGVLVASYTLMGLVSRAPVAAESTVKIAGDESHAIADEVFATGAMPAVKARGPWLASADPVPHFKVARQTYSGPALAYLIGGLPLYSSRDVGRAFTDMEHARRLAKIRQARISPPRRVPVLVQDYAPVRRERMVAAITP